MKKADRMAVYAKFGGHCAYCGVEIGDKFHVDHVVPMRRGCAYNNGPAWRDIPEDIKSLLREKNKKIDSIENMFPACPRCNLWKHSMTVEQFRNDIQAQCERLRRYQSGFRIAEDFGLLKDTRAEVIFYFEKV